MQVISTKVNITFFHVCAQTQLCPDMIVPRHIWFVPRHDCAQTHLICAQTWLCPDTFVPQHEILWPNTLVNNNIIIVSTILLMCQLDSSKHKHAQLLLSKRSEMWLFNYCSAINSSVPTGIFRYFILTCLGTIYVSGHKHTRFCTDMIVTTRL